MTENTFAVYIISNAIEDFLSVNEWQINETIKAIPEADKPGAEFTGHEELMAKWKAKLENTADQDGCNMFW